MFYDERTKLQNRVDLMNELNCICNRLQPEMIELFRGYLGKKIAKVDDHFVVGLQREISELLKEHDLIHYCTPTKPLGNVVINSAVIRCYVKGCYKVSDHGVEYCDQNFVVGYRRYTDYRFTSTLDELRDIVDNFKTDYDVDSILQAREEIVKRQKEIVMIKQMIYPFAN